MEVKWWGYKHVNGSFQVKRFFSELDIQEALESPFVAEVYRPFNSSGREEALNILREKCGDKK